MSGEVSTTGHVNGPIPFDPFMASIFTAMASQSAASTNAALDSLEARVRDMEDHFLQFFDAVSRANVRIDSARLERILFGWEWLANEIGRRRERS